MGILDKLFNRKLSEVKKNLLLNQDEQSKRGKINICKLQMEYKTIEEIKRRYIAFDIETTGLSWAQDKIIEVGAILFENGEITGKYSTLVNPEVLIPSKATEVNNITNEMIKNAPKEKEVYKELVEFLGDALKQQTVICAHSATFDMNFLKETLMRLGYDGEICYVDTLSLSRDLIKGLVNYKQNTVARYFDLVNNQSHRADTDAEICGKILWELLKIKSQEEKELIEILEKVNQVLRKWRYVLIYKNVLWKEAEILNG